ncbi:hypothetical protein IAR55_001128 [Kwoniella newhampshirensis]|uniref:Uncharacterized protein n=1 Tax=Kwoniella newhampshirensis TaxID=1651941 RepID=A0AAW0Z4R3_9TREE
MLDDMSNTVTPSPARRRPIKPQAENWDDDFEFALPTSASNNKKVNNTSFTTSASKENVEVGVKPSGGKAIQVEDWNQDEEEEEDWDDSPPRSSAVPELTPVILAGPSRQMASHQQANLLAPLKISVNSHPQPPPRLSPSRSKPLPSPSTFPTSHVSPSSTDAQTIMTSRSHSSSMLTSPIGQQPVLPRSRSGSTSTGTVTRNKLVKRHPSTSFIPVPTRSTSATYHDLSASMSFIPSANRSSPNLPHPPPVPPLPRSTSGEQMPPPPLPGPSHGLGRSRSRSISKARSGGRQDVRVYNIPFSPSREDMQDKEVDEEKQKRPGFWKRLSGIPTTSRDAAVHSSQHRRRRSSSVGGKGRVEPSSPKPPIPSMPPNLRTPSSTSAVSASSSTRSGPTYAFSELLRRSSSSLSRRSDKSRDAPPSSYPYPSGIERVSTTSINAYHSPPAMPILTPSRRGDITPELPSSSSSFSRGFHLPSPSPGSPYHSSMSKYQDTVLPIANSIPPLPHSASFPGPLRPDQSDTETEADGETPKKRKKVRPVSTLPAPKMTSGKGWDGEGWRGFIELKPRSDQSDNIVGLPNERVALTSPQLSTFVSTTSSTLKRIGSLSKKHGRRLSGGWKFGTGTSPGLNNSKDRAATSALETVAGSPSKLPKGADTMIISSKVEESMRSAIRAGSVSAPNSAFKSGPTHDDLATFAAAPIGPSEGEVSSMMDAKKKDKHRRRQSWNDFVIPREVMEKQKSLKEKIGAVKMFAGGVDSLKNLLSTHDELRQKAYASGSPSEIAHFQSLEWEFSQWWEMATVLIEVSSTGQDPSTQVSLSDPPRSRRVTMASDEAKVASEAMRKASSAPEDPGIDVSLSRARLQEGNRKSSLPDPDETSLGITTTSAPPKASPPDQWRASTGRQDLSKRQLEVLRTMLRTPVGGRASGSYRSSRRPSLGGRASSTLSASMTASSLLQSSPETVISSSLTMTRSSSRSVSVGRSDTPNEESSISFPGPGDSVHIVPSESLPRPVTASRRAQPRPEPLPVATPTTIASKTMKERRTSRAGLAGLKEFLRSLKSRDRLSTSGPDGGSSPMRKLRSKTNKMSTSPPASPIESGVFFASRMDQGYPDAMFYPTSTCRNSFSALGPLPAARLPGSGATSRVPSDQSQISVQTQSIQSTASPTVSGTPSRSTSRHQSPRMENTSPQLNALSPDAPKRPSLRNIFRTSSGNWSELISGGSGSGGSSHGGGGSPSLLKKASTPRLPFSESRFRSGKPISGSPSMSRVSVSDPMPKSVSSATLSAATSTSNLISQSNLSESKELGMKSIVKSESSRTLTAENGGDMTLRPTRKSRVLGLGLGLGWPEREREVVAGELSQWPEGGSYASSSAPIAVPSSDQSLPDGIAFATSPNASSPTNMDDKHDHLPTMSRDGPSDDLVVALTPENLPTLLEYMRQCEKKLQEWKERIGELELARDYQT